MNAKVTLAVRAYAQVLRPLAAAAVSVALSSQAVADPYSGGGLDALTCARCADAESMPEVSDCLMCLKGCLVW